MVEQSDYRPVAQSAQPSTAQLLKVLTPEIARAVPKGMDADRIARLVTTEIRKSRNARAAGTAKHSLDECTQESFAGALLTASALGLEPGVAGECYLIPYRDNRRRVVECQLVIGYQGVVKLFWQHPRAARIDAQAVCANDSFRYCRGLDPILEHTPASGERGAAVAYYAIVEVTGARPLWDVFTVAEVAKLRRGKVGSSGDIADPQHWMERKTALKQVLKLAPKTTRLDAAMRSDEAGGTELSRSQAMELPGGVESTPDYVDGEVEPDEPGPGAPAAEVKPGAARRKWLNRMFALLAEGDCDDRDDQLIVIAALNGGQRPEHRDALTDDELRAVVEPLAAWSKAGELGAQITEILNTAALAEAGIDTGAEAGAGTATENGGQ